MKRALIALFTIWALSVLIMLVRRTLALRRGPKVCEQWSCPECRAPFGPAAVVGRWHRRIEWRWLRDLFSGPVMRCSQCGRRYWFTWSGGLIATDSIKPPASVETREEAIT